MSMQFRPLNYLPLKANSLKEAEMVVPFRPENIVLFEKEKLGVNRIRNFDFGRFCFTRRDFQRKRNSVNGKKELKVDLSSLRAERRDFIESATLFIRESTFSERSIEDKAHKLTHFFFFVESALEEDEWPYTEKKALICYQKYVENLILRSRLPKDAKDGISSHGAAALGKTARQLIESAYGLSQREIERKVPSIMHIQSPTRTEPASRSDRQTFIYVCLSIFEQFHEAILNRKPFPWRINLSNTGLNKTFIWGGRSSLKSTFDPYFYREGGEMVTLFEFSTMLDSLGCYKPSDVVRINGAGNYKRSTAIGWFKNRQKRWDEINNQNDIYDGLLYTSWEIATRSFWYCFLAATGLNYSVTSNLVYGSEEYNPQRGYVFSGLKVRAGNKIVHAEFRKEFERYFKKFKELRSWAVSQLDSEPPLWFFLFADPESNQSRLGIQRLNGARKIHKNSYKKISSGRSNTLKTIFEKNNIPVVLVSPTDLRKGVSFDWYKLSGGDSIMVAHKLGNTVKTVQQTYSDVNEEDAYPELSDFYNKMIERVKSDGQSAQGEIPVNIIEDNEFDNLPVGHCNNSTFLKPRKSDQFGDAAPNPDCARSETCLFCEFFAIHADRSGLKKLLSFRELFPLIKERSGSIDRYITIFAPIEGRIEEILKHIKESYPEKSNLLKEISSEVLEGELDDFWEHHFNFLIELGYAE
ncbi:hypothetical protein [Halomonas sp. KRD171]|uniref:hypothetical protein n=1 Tax=Halomonas sp. KRD171 TaxID=2729726 RepID=UPI0019D1A1F0|nr:hypothetical protein [Halomonas sp. KRD171]